ncbi:MAG: hypothetical protein ACTSQI_17160 [Candidatus Helarchaeota archaeon]
MITTNLIGESITLFEFMKVVIDFYKDKLVGIDAEEEIFKISLPDDIQKDIGINFNNFNNFNNFSNKIRINMEVRVIYDGFESIILKNPLVTGLIEKVKNEAFIEENQLYERTTTFSSRKCTKISTIYDYKLRCFVDTIPKSMIKEIILIGLELVEDNEIIEENFKKIWNSRPLNVETKEIKLKKHLKNAFTYPLFDEVIRNGIQRRIDDLIIEREKLISPTVNSLNLILGINSLQAIYFVSIINALVFNYGCRQKVGGSHLKQFILELKQLLVINFNSWKKFQEIIIPKCLELLYTSNELSDFSKDLGLIIRPFEWNEKRRFRLKAKLNAIITRLFGLIKPDLDHILKTFPIIKKRDISKYVHYFTKEKIIECYDEFENVSTKNN